MHRVPLDRQALVLLSCGFFLSSCQAPRSTFASTETTAGDPSYGYAQENPIRVGGNLDYGAYCEKRFLATLGGALGLPVVHTRKGSCCPFDIPGSALGGGMLDIYLVCCPPAELYIDMYNCDDPKAPVGFISRREILPGGGRISYALVGSMFINGNGVYLVEGEGACIRQIVEDPSPYHTAWSPDGRWIAYSSMQGERSELYLVDVLDGSRRRLAEDFEWAGLASWSPDGTRLAFSGQLDGTMDIFVLSITNGELGRLTEDKFWDIDPSWSPDTTEIVFASDRDGNFEIYRLALDRPRLVRITNDPGTDVQPDWSPDGRSIAFVSDRDGSPGIFVMSLDGEEFKGLTSGGREEFSPEWSPDGSRIAFCGYGRGAWDIAVMDAEGGNVVIVAGAPGDECGIDWIPSE